MSIRRSPLLLFFAAAFLSSCEENAIRDITGPDPGARIKFFNFGVNAPGVNFYAGDTKITAINSATGTESTTGTAYGGVGLGGLYSAIAPGSYEFKGRIAAAVDKDLAISNVPATVQAGKHYSFYQSGFYNTTTKTVESFIVEDDFPAAINYSVALVRFVNAISNANAMTLYAKNTTTGVEVALGGAVAYKSAGAFTALPGGAYDLITRYTGSQTDVLTRTGLSFAPGKVYTIGALGDITVTSGTATNRARLDNTANR